MSIFTERTDGAKFHKVKVQRLVPGVPPFNFAAKMARFNHEIALLTRRMGNMAEEHMNRNFEIESFVDDDIKRWPKKKRPDGKKVLHKTGAMKATTRVSGLTTTEVTIVSEMPYSGHHNHPVGTRKGRLPGRQFMGHSRDLARATQKMIVTRLNIAAQQ